MPSLKALAPFLLLLPLTANGFTRSRARPVTQVPAQESAPESAAGPDRAPASATTSSDDSACGGMGELPAGSVERKNGYLTQNLTYPGYCLNGVPPPYQGQRANFGSCSMAGSITLLNGFVKAHHLEVQPEDHPFFQLGTVVPYHRKNMFWKVGNYDQAVENNFVDCFGHYPAVAPKMAECVSQKLGKSSCAALNASQPKEASPVELASEIRSRLSQDMGSSNYCPDAEHPAAKRGELRSCPAPRPQTHDGGVSARRAFLREHFSNPDPGRITPLTFPWDPRLVDGPPQRSDLDVALTHISTLVGRRINTSGGCEILIRNSWGNCANQRVGYPHGSCDNLGHTDDVWVDEASFMKRSGALTSLDD
jgi:hypothetical protein